MERKFQSFFAAVGLLGLMLFVEPAVGQKAPAPQGTKILRVGYVSPLAGTGLPHMVAKGKGWFTEERLEPTVVYTREGIPGLLGGSLDIVSEGADEALFARKQGEDLIIVDIIENKPASGYFVARSGITSIRQTRGKTIGVPDIPSGVYFLTIQLLERHGLSKDDVIWRKVGSTQARAAALEKGVIDASILNLLGWVNVQKFGRFNLLATPTNLGPFPWQMLIVKARWAHANEEALVGYIRAIERAKRWILDPANEDQIVQIYLRQLPRGVKIDTETARTLIKGHRDEDFYDLEPLTPAKLEPAIEQMKLGGAEGPFDVKGILNIAYYEKAMVGLVETEQGY